MEENNATPPPAPDPIETPTPFVPDKKKIMIFGGVALLIVLLVSVIAIMSSPNRSALPVTGGQENTAGSNNNSTSLPTTIPSKKVAPQDPKVAAQNFYTWYVNHPNPIKSGEYEAREDITPEFKETMGRFVKQGIDPGYDHVFCEGLVLPKIVTVADTIYNESQNLALIAMSENNPDGVDLFQIKMQNAGGAWQVLDIYCIEHE